MKKHVAKSVVLVAMVALAGCTSDFYDSRIQGYTPEMPEQTYPISVVKGAVKLELPLAQSRLSMKERTAVHRLGRDAVLHNTPIIVERPAGSVRAEVKAAEVTRVLVRDAGIKSHRIRHVKRRGGNTIVVRYDRKFAVTRECGDWSKPLTETNGNTVYKNFGCAQQHNIAAMVDNPEDFERPRVMSGVDIDTRNGAMEKYRKREDYTSSWPAGVKIRVDESVKSAVQK